MTTASNVSVRVSLDADRSETVAPRCMGYSLTRRTPTYPRTAGTSKKTRARL